MSIFMMDYNIRKVILLNFINWNHYSLSLFCCRLVQRRAKILNHFFEKLRYKISVKLGAVYIWFVLAKKERAEEKLRQIRGE
jgi:hypothetical protein